MKHLFLAVVSMLIPLFLAWVAIYYSQGYNLTDNVARLDMATMINKFNNNLDTFSVNFMTSIRSKLLSYFDDLWAYMGKVSYSQTVYGNNTWSIVVNVLNATYKIVNAIVRPITKFVGFLNYINKILDYMLGFIIAVAKFILNPTFVPVAS